METRRQGLPLLTGVCLLIGTLVVIQIWLVSASVDALLSDDTAVLLPAAGASLLLFLVNGGLILHLLGFDRRLRRRDPP